MITNGTSAPTQFAWRKYIRGYSLGGGPLTAPAKTTLHNTYLTDGLSVYWQARCTDGRSGVDRYLVGR